MEQLKKGDIVVGRIPLLGQIGPAHGEGKLYMVVGPATTWDNRIIYRVKQLQRGLPIPSFFRCDLRLHER